MKKEEIMERMSFVLAGEYLEKVRVHERANNEIVVQVDVHGMSANVARRTLTNIIAILREPFTLDVIHGFNRGVAIKNIIRTDLASNKIKWASSPNWNPGETFLQIA